MTAKIDESIINIGKLWYSYDDFQNKYTKTNNKYYNTTLQSYDYFEHKNSNGNLYKDVYYILNGKVFVKLKTSEWYITLILIINAV